MERVVDQTNKKPLVVGISPPEAVPKLFVKDKIIGRLLSRSKPKTNNPKQEDQLIQSLSEISNETQKSVATIPGSPNAPQTIKSFWALSISERKDVKERFDDLQRSVDDYNAAASKEKMDLIQKQGSTLEEVRRLAEIRQSKSAPEAGGDSKIKDGLQQFCKTILHYSEVMDVLMEHHPEWVALAWGTIKLFLIIPLEYQKIQDGVTKNLGIIGDKLQLVAILLRFFPSEKMVDASSVIYASVAEFLGTSLSWLRHGWFVRTLKAVAVPYETCLGPLLGKIDESYAILKEHAEIQWLISDFERHLQTQNDLFIVKKTQGRVLEILEDIVKQDHLRMERQSQAIEGSKAVDRSLFRPPILDICKEFFPELLPIEQNLQRAQTQMNLLPITRISEGVNMVQRKEFRAWMETDDSALLWIDGYQVPHRPSWTTGFAINIIQAAMKNGSGTLFYFGSLYQESPHPRALVQSLLFHLLQRYPDIMSFGDPELFNTEIFLAAKSSLDLSWRLFLECLRLIPSPIVYLVVEGIDHVKMSNVLDDFESLLGYLKSLSSTSAVEAKVLKILLTSVRSDGGFDILFPRHETLVTQVDNDVLIRVPQVAARSRRKYTKRPPRITLSAVDMPPLPELLFCGQSGSQVMDAEEFAPSDEDPREENADCDSDSDFDIFGESPRIKKRAIINKNFMLEEVNSANQDSSKVQGAPFQELDRLVDTRQKHDTVEDDQGSDSSFDIFDLRDRPRKSKRRRQSLDFAPSDGETI